MRSDASPNNNLFEWNERNPLSDGRGSKKKKKKFQPQIKNRSSCLTHLFPGQVEVIELDVLID